MSSTEIKTIELIVNSEQAKKQIDELNNSLTTKKQRLLYFGFTEVACAWK